MLPKKLRQLLILLGFKKVRDLGRTVLAGFRRKALIEEKAEFKRALTAGTSEINLENYQLAEENLKALLQEFSKLSGLELFQGHLDKLLSASEEACSGKVELEEYYKAVIGLNRQADKKRASQSLNKKTGLKVLVFSGMSPSIRHGGGLRLFDIINELPDDYQIDLYCRYDKDLDKKSIEMLKPKLNSIRLVKDLEVDPIGKWFLERQIGEGYYDIIQVEYPDSVPFIGFLKPFSKKIGFTYMEVSSRRIAIDIINLIREEQLDDLGEVARRFIFSLAAEKSAMIDTEFTIAVTEEDAEFCKVFGGRYPHIVPTGVSSCIVNDSNESDISTVFTDLPRAAVFVGYYDHFPNIEAAQWYLRNIHQKVLERVSDYKVYIVGGGDTSQLKKEFGGMASVEFTGWVENLAPSIGKGAICISPLISGAGIRGKLNQYSIYQRPSVSTSIGVSGINYQHGESVLIADEPSEFANAIVDLVSDQKLWQHIHSGSQQVVSDWVWPKIIHKLQDVYES